MTIIVDSIDRSTLFQKQRNRRDVVCACRSHKRSLAVLVARIDGDKRDQKGYDVCTARRCLQKGFFSDSALE